MREFNYKIERIVGLNCPAKSLLIINDVAICFANSKTSLADCIKYASTKDDKCLENKKIKNKIDSVLDK